MERDEQRSFLVRYGVMGHLGRFSLDPRVFSAPERGQKVVIRSDRGLELGEVLLPLDQAETVDGHGQADSDGPSLLRPAGGDDVESFRLSERLLASRFALCRQILEEGDWPLELIDVEPLLGPESVVLHYLGPRNLDLSLLRARFRSECDFDVHFEVASAGFEDEPESTDPGPEASPREHRCGDCDCSGGECHSRAKGKSSVSRPTTKVTVDEPRKACGTVEHSGCANCGVSKWFAAKAH
jgi:hypothetical protein